MIGHGLKASFEAPSSSSAITMRSVEGYLDCFGVFVNSQASVHLLSRYEESLPVSCDVHR